MKKHGLYSRPDMTLYINYSVRLQASKAKYSITGYTHIVFIYGVHFVDQFLLLKASNRHVVYSMVYLWYTMLYTRFTVEVSCCY